MAIVGSSVVVGKVVVARLPVFLVGGLRFALAAAVLVPLLLWREGRAAKLERRDAAVLTIQALAGIFAFNALMLSGLKYTSAAAGGVVTATTPAVAAVLAALLLGEAWTRRRTLAVALTVLGLLVLALPGAAAAGSGERPILGGVLIFGAVVGEGVFVVCSRVASRRLSPLRVATAISVLGLAMFAPFAAWEARGIELAAVRLADWLAIGYYGVVVTVVAFLLWARGVARVPAGTAAVFTGVLPISAVALSYVVLGEPFSWTHVAGAGCVIAGIVTLARADA